MISRLTSTLLACREAGRSALVPFFTGGFPDRQTFIELLLEAERRGADAVEVGVPFSDPSADGPVTQEASRSSLTKGTSLATIFADLGRARSAGFGLPVVLMTYLNPLLAYSTTELVRQSRLTDVHGLLVVDLPPEAANEVLGRPLEWPLDRIVMVAPATTRDRMRSVLRDAQGFVYCVSMMGVTGTCGASVTTAAEVVARVRDHSDLPALVGFGIQDAQTAKQMSMVSDGVVVGSALLAYLKGSSGSQAVDAAGNFLGRMRSALDA